MRTFVTWRFWLTLVALAGLTFALLQVTKDDGASAAPKPVQTRTQEREIDLIAPVFLAQADRATSIINGVTTGRIQIRVDGFRYMNIQPGTPGENRCGELAELASCVVVADLLGEAVLWFSLLPAEPRNEVTLPDVVEVRDNSFVLLSNGWLVRHADIVARNCDDDVPSFSEFVREHAEGSTTTFSLDQQKVVAVTCAGTVVEDTTPRATIAPTNR